jgi:hypothetical protein
LGFGLLVFGGTLSFLIAIYLVLAALFLFTIPLIIIGASLMYVGRTRTQTILEETEVNPETGKEQRKSIEEIEEPVKASRAWFVLPVLLGFIGGLIMFFALWNKDRSSAKMGIIIGIIFSFLWFLLIYLAILGAAAR